MRLYSVTDIIEDECVLVVARSAKEAKTVGMTELEHDLFNVKARWVKGVEMRNDQEGILRRPLMDAPGVFWEYIGENTRCKFM